MLSCCLLEEEDRQRRRAAQIRMKEEQEDKKDRVFGKIQAAFLSGFLLLVGAECSQDFQEIFHPVALGALGLVVSVVSLLFELDR